MSRFLMFLCLTMGLIITGCGGEAKKDGKEGVQETTKEDEKGSAAKGSTSKDDKGGEKKADAKEEKKEDKKASAAKAPEAQLVSIKLPNMT